MDFLTSNDYLSHQIPSNMVELYSQIDSLTCSQTVDHLKVISVVHNILFVEKLERVKLPPLDFDGAAVANVVSDCAAAVDDFPAELPPTDHTTRLTHLAKTKPRNFLLCLEKLHSFWVPVVENGEYSFSLPVQRFYEFIVKLFVQFRPSLDTDLPPKPESPLSDKEVAFVTNFFTQAIHTELENTVRNLFVNYAEPEFWQAFSDSIDGAFTYFYCLNDLFDALLRLYR